MVKINPDRRGRDLWGRYVYRPLVEAELDDFEDEFPPDTVYWQQRAEVAVDRLTDLITDYGYLDWAEETFPDDMETLTWREICETIEGKIEEIET